MVKITDTDRGFKKLVKTSRELKRVRWVNIGLFVDQGRGLTTKGWANEFGVPELKIPERSFMRSAVDDNKETILNALALAWARVSTGTITAKAALQGLGIGGERLIQRKILSNIQPENAPRTLANKAPETRTLIHTKDMLNSIKSRIP